MMVMMMSRGKTRKRETEREREREREIGVGDWRGSTCMRRGMDGIGLAGEVEIVCEKKSNIV